MLRSALIRFFVISSISVVIFLSFTVWQRNRDTRTWYVGEDEMQWSQSRFPLKVMMGDGVEEHESSFRLAIEHFNSRVGCTIYTVTDSLDAADVMIMAPDPSQVSITRNHSTYAAVDSHDIYFWKTFFQGIQYGVGVLKPMSDPVNAYYNIYHELGHIIGLEEDTANRSIMNPKVRHESDPQLNPYLTNTDAEAIRDRYCVPTVQTLSAT